MSPPRLGRACIVTVVMGCAGVAAAAQLGAFKAAQTSPASPTFVGTTIYVSTTGSDSDPGTQARPVRTIQRGVDLADRANGDGRDALVSIAAGTYRESVDLRERSTSHALILQGAGTKPEDVVITGADDWSVGWTEQGDGSYVHEWPYAWGMKPLPPQWEAFWNTLRDEDKDTLRRSEMVYVNGRPLKATLALSRLTAGVFFVDEPGKKIYLIPPSGVAVGDGITKVEVGTRVTQIRVQRREKVTVANLAVMRNRGALQDSSVHVTSAKNLTLDRVQIRWAATGGFGSSNSSNLNLAASVFSDNGVIGVGNFRDSAVTIQDSDISRNNWRGAAHGMFGWESVHKWVGVREGRVVRTTFSDNQGNGFWLDTDNQEITLENSLVSGNLLQGLDLENNQGPITVTGNRICRNTVAGVGNAQSEAVTLVRNDIFENAQSNIFFTGTYCGQRATDHRTGVTTLNRSAAWTIADNVIAGSGSQDLFTHTNHRCPGAWEYTRDRLTLIDRNRWFHDRDEVFHLPDGHVTHSKFKSDLEQANGEFERKSTFDRAAPRLSCTLP